MTNVSYTDMHFHLFNVFVFYMYFLYFIDYVTRDGNVYITKVVVIVVFAMKGKQVVFILNKTMFRHDTLN